MDADIDLPIEAGRRRGGQLRGSNLYGCQTIAHGNNSCPLDCVHADDAGDREIRGFAEDLLDGTALPDASLIENDHVIRQRKSFDPIVSHEHSGNPELRQQTAQLAPQLFAQRYIERRQRFVQQQQVRVTNERPRQGYPLPLAA